MFASSDKSPNGMQPGGMPPNGMQPGGMLPYMQAQPGYPGGMQPGGMPPGGMSPYPQGQDPASFQPGGYPGGPAAMPPGGMPRSMTPQRQESGGGSSAPRRTRENGSATPQMGGPQMPPFGAPMPPSRAAPGSPMSQRSQGGLSQSSSMPPSGPGGMPMQNPGLMPRQGSLPMQQPQPNYAMQAPSTMQRNQSAAGPPGANFPPQPGYGALGGMPPSSMGGMPPSSMLQGPGGMGGLETPGLSAMVQRRGQPGGSANASPGPPQLPMPGPGTPGVEGRPNSPQPQPHWRALAPLACHAAVSGVGERPAFEQRRAGFEQRKLT